MDIILTITGTCAGGNHIYLNVTVNGETRQLTFVKDDFLKDGEMNTFDETGAIRKELRAYLRRQGIKTWAAAQSAVQNLSLTI